MPSAARAAPDHTSPSLRIFAMPCPSDFPVRTGASGPKKIKPISADRGQCRAPSPTGTRWKAVSRMIGFVLAKNGEFVSYPTPCDANLLLNTTVLIYHKV